MRFILTVVFILIFETAFAIKREAMVTDTSLVGYFIIENDTSYNIKVNYRFGEWVIYYDFAHKDSAYHIQYMQNGYTSSEWYRNGQLKRVYPQVAVAGRFEMTEWYPDGKLKTSRKCSADSCVTFEYYRTGQIADKSIDLRDSIDHFMKWHYNVQYYENGQLKFDPYDPNSFKVQRVMNYYSSGAKQIQNDVFSMARVGPFKEWYESGQLKTEGNYTDYPNDGKYHNSTKTGKWSYYNESGKLTKEEFYEENKLVNTITY
jgi:antitoxin component YwqK of YwqJK toxin-antitoxin module